MSSVQAPHQRRLRARRLTAIALVVAFLPITVVAPSASAAPGEGWSLPTIMPDTGGTVSNWMDMAGDGNGLLFAAWSNWGGTEYEVYVNRFVPGFGWTGGVVVSTGDLDGFAPSIAADANGNAFVIWHEWNGSAYLIGYARYVVGAGWQRASNFTADYGPSGSMVEPRLAMDGKGTGYVYAMVYNGTAYRAWAGAEALDGTQTPFQPLDAGGITVNFYQFTVAGSPRGGAIALYAGFNGTNSNIYASQHDSASGWSAAAQIDVSTASATYPAVGFDSDGEALAVWNQAYGGHGILEARWTAASGWSAPDRAATSSFTGTFLEVGVTPSGNAVVAWRTSNGTANVPTAMRYLQGIGWSAPQRASVNITVSNGLQSLAVDEVGDAVYAFSRPFGGIRPLYAAEFTGAGWGSAVAVHEVDYTMQAQRVKLVSTGHRTAAVVWTEYTGSNYQGRFNFFRGVDDVAPWVKIDTPINGSSWGDGFVYVSGYAEPGARVTVNGVTAVTFPNGAYQVVLPLSEGLNYLWALAVDADGNVGYSNFRYVTQTNPAPVLAAERAQIGRTGWQDIIHLDNLSMGGGWWPLVRSDAYGNAYAVWYEWSGNGYSAYAARYQYGVGWGTPVQLRVAPDGSGIYDEATLAVTPNGHAVFVWSEYNSANSNATVWVRDCYYGFWTEPFRIDNGSNVAYQYDAAASSDNQVAVVWRQNTPTSTASTYAIIYNESTYWGSRTALSNGTNVTHAPSVAFDGFGTAHVTAANRTGSFDRIFLYNHTAGGSWTGPVLLETLPYQIGSYAHVESDYYGNLTLAWLEARSGQYDTKAGRLINGTWMGNQTLWTNGWSWWPEVIVDGRGNGYVANTESTASEANMWVAVAAPGANFTAPQRLGNVTYHDGGPRLSLSYSGQFARVHWDGINGSRWQGWMSEFNTTTRSWSAAQVISTPARDTGIPDMAPMPDGGMLAVWMESDPVLGFSQVVARRYVPPETIPPFLAVYTPVPAFTTNVSVVSVSGYTEPGATVTVNGIAAAVASNGTFRVDVPLVNGTNSIYVVATDPVGNTMSAWRNGTYDDPDRRRVEQLESLNQALQNQLNSTNASLWAALNGQNASLLAQLVAQNASLLNAIAGLNASLLAQMAAEDAALAQAIADGDSALLGELATVNADLLDAIADTNASLLASLAAQNNALLTTIAATNASLLAQLAAQNASVMDALGDLNQTLLAQMAAEDAALAQLIADTNATLLAELAAQNDALTTLIADTNMSLLASLAVQNDDLLARIAATNSSLLAELAAGDAALFAKLTANHGALWAQLNVTSDSQNTTAQENEDINEGQDTSISASQADAAAARAAANGAGMMALLGILIGAAGVGVGALAFLASRKRPPQIDGSPPPMVVENVEVVGQPTIQEPGGRAGSHGHSMGAESELSAKAEDD